MEQLEKWKMGERRILRLCGKLVGLTEVWEKWERPEGGRKSEEWEQEIVSWRTPTLTLKTPQHSTMRTPRRRLRLPRDPVHVMGFNGNYFGVPKFDASFLILRAVTPVIMTNISCGNFLLIARLNWLLLWKMAWCHIRKESDTRRQNYWEITARESSLWNLVLFEGGLMDFLNRARWNFDITRTKHSRKSGGHKNFSVMSTSLWTEPHGKWNAFML